MSKPTQERPIAERFSQDIFPSGVGIGGKGTTKFADVQEKSHFLMFFCSAGYRRALDRWRVTGGSSLRCKSVLCACSG